jgi:TonB family protein
VIQRVAPEYSAEARAANYQGTVMVSVYIDEDGRAQDVRLIRGLGMGLDANALAAVRQWQFKPATTDGKPVRATQPFEVDFKLRGGGPWLLAGASYTPIVPEAAYRPAPGKPWPVISKPTLLHYGPPDEAACSGNGDYISVNLQIGEDGVPSEVKMAATTGGADPPAVVKAVESWKFDPARAGRMPVPAKATILLRCEGAPPSGPAAEREAVHRVGGGTSAPSLIFKVEPEYSEEARKAKLQGSVLLSLVVDGTGKPGRMQILRALGLGLEQKALEAVAQWRFRPGVKDGKPVTVQATVEVNFRLL